MRRCEFAEIAGQYKAVFFDAYGVIKNYKGIIPGISQTLKYMDHHGVNYYVLTNDASRSPEMLAASYHKAGLQQLTSDKIISSGMLAREYLTNKVKGGVVTYLGTIESAHYIETAGLKTLSIRDLDINNIEMVSAVAMLDDEGFDWNHDINKLLNLLRQKNIPVIVANTDESYPISNKEVAIAIGGIADMVEDILSRTFIRFGKPDAQMYSFAYDIVLRKNLDISKNEILMVGDTLRTDIVGGNKFGIDTALVLTGNTQSNRADVLIETSGIIPDYICESALMNPL